MQAFAGPSSASSSSSSSAAQRHDRLFIGNLAPTVDEYALIQIFSKFGKITKLDFMFHKTGPMKGKPRGYAFVEYSNKDEGQKESVGQRWVELNLVRYFFSAAIRKDALKALVKLNDRLLRGRKLVVTLANAAPPTDDGGQWRHRKAGEAVKPTTLSLLKSQRKPGGADAQIAAMEAKLAAMQNRPGRSAMPDPSTSAAGLSRTEHEGILEGDTNTALGREAGEQAADELEKEMQRELEDAAELEEVGGGSENVAEKQESEVQTTEKASGEDIEEEEVGRKRQKVNDEVHRRGLAGLPKKPVF